ncbi:DUF2239 family protein [Nevskia soli]|uniref:DUF2239 family protein n=1 Tax=Nevskia soli TaxID=418856 RepID=UPI0004A73912|nr:DUF2239 family protein [Nevskia soli]
MNDASPASRFPPCTAFDGQRRLATGPLDRVALAVKTAIEDGAAGPVLIYGDDTGRVIDVDTRGNEGEVLARLALIHRAAPSTQPTDAEPADTEPRGRGRPRLGVIAREVTLLPRHWEWLGTQPGGASVALRKLVEAARRDHRAADDGRRRRDAAYHFMSAMAGDLPGFEEATRALYAGDGGRLRVHIAGWPQDLREHVVRLADGEPSTTAT